MDYEELISIIVPVYNIKDYLPKCIETITSQTYHKLEVILVDDGSTDGSGFLCDRYAEKDCRVKVIHQHNMGQWAARNIGKNAANGQYIMFVDGDDYLHLDAVKLLYNSINRKDCYDIAIADYKVTYKQDEDIFKQIDCYETEWMQEDLVSHLVINHHGRLRLVSLWNKLYRRKIIEKHQFQPYLRSEDFDFNLHVFMEVKSVIFINQVLYFYVQRSSSLVHQNDSLRIHYQCLLQILMLNLKNLSSENRKYYPLLLKKLYRQMAMAIAISRKIGAEITIKNQCNQYVKETKRMYWKEPHINPFEKVTVMLLIRFPSLMRWFMKRTKNY